MTRHTKSDVYERQSSPISRRSRRRSIVLCYRLHSMVCFAPACMMFFVDICTSAVRVLDDLFTAGVRCVIRLFGMALASALIAAILFGLARTIFHPLFVG